MFGIPLGWIIVAAVVAVGIVGYLQYKKGGWPFAKKTA
jgi:hypothetical protein